MQLMKNNAANILNDHKEKFFFLVAILLVFIIASRTPLDSDTWWHLRAGEDTLRNHAPVMVDQYSYTRLNTPWINHSWLAQVILFGSYYLGGFLGLSLFTAILASLSMAVVYKQLEGPAILKPFVIFLGSLVASLVWMPRPQMFSLVFLAVVSLLLYQYKYKKQDYLWVLPILFFLWVNLHGGFALGFILLGCFILGESLNHLPGSEANIIPWRNIGKVILWGGFSVLALSLNPNGIKIYLIPFQTVGVGVLQNFIAEWASPNFHDISQQTFLWLAIIIFACAAMMKQGMDITDLITVCVLGYMALVAGRNYGPFAVVAIPIISRLLIISSKNWKNSVPEDVIKKLSSWFSSLQKTNQVNSNRSSRVINLVVVGLLGFCAVWKIWAVSYPAMVGKLEHGTYPTAAVEMLKNQSQLRAQLFSEYDWGGYLIWADRELPVAVDGRTDLYGDEILKKWMIVVQAEDGWKDVMDSWGVNTVMLRPDRPIIKLLPFYGWKELYRDQIAVIMTRNQLSP